MDGIIVIWLSIWVYVKLRKLKFYRIVTDSQWTREPKFSLENQFVKLEITNMAPGPRSHSRYTYVWVCDFVCVCTYTQLYGDIDHSNKIEF